MERHIKNNSKELEEKTKYLKVLEDIQNDFNIFV